MSIKLLDPKDATFELALEASKIFYDAFHPNPLSLVLHGPRYCIPTPPPAGSLRDYNKVVRYLAYKQWLRFRDPNNRIWMIYDGTTLVGFCMWYMPRNLHKLVPLLHRLKNFFITQWTKVVNFVYFRWAKDAPLSNPDVMRMFYESEEAVGVTKLQVPATELAHMTRDELAKARYSINEYSWCQLFALRSDYHGKGYGKKLFLHCMENMPRYEPVFADGPVQSQGPAKFGLFATDSGKPLYEKCGWRVVDNYSTDVGDVHLEMPLLVYTCE